MDERRARMRVGIFVLVGVGIASAFLAVLGNIGLYGGQALVLYARESSGLKVRAPVRILGIDAGLVREVALVTSGVPIHDDHPYPIRVDLTIGEEHLPLLRRDARFTIEPSTILGEKVVAVEPGHPDSPPLDLAQPAWAAPSGGMEQAMAQASALAERLEDMLARTDILEKGSALLDEGRTTLTRVAGRVEGTLDGVDQTLADVRAKLAQVEVPRIEQARVDRLLDRLDTLLAEANRQVPAVAGDARALLGEAREATAELKAVAGRLAPGAEQAMGRVNALLAEVGEGQGLLALLLKDREIYYDLKELVRDLKHHPWKVLWKD